MDPDAHLAAIVESSDDAIIGKTLDGVVVSWNRGAERLYGYSAEEMIGRSIKDLAPPERQAEIDDIHARLRRGERIEHHETVRVAKDGRRIDVAVTISPVRNPRGEVVGAATIARDITERKVLEERLRYLVYHDELTGLANRRKLLDECERHVRHCLRYCWRGALLLVDLDGLKTVNDSLGHSAGDRLIVQTAERLRVTMRESDVVARLGGDEFAILLPEADDVAAEAAARKVVAALPAQDLSVGDLRVGTASVGIAAITGPVTADDLMVRADQAMYRAKAQGGDRVAFAAMAAHVR